MIVELLPIGKENAISTADLKTASGISNIRALRAAVARERKLGEVILSSKNGGYYRPATEQEVKEFIKTNSKEAKSILYGLRSAKQYLNTLQNKDQLCIDS